MGSAQCLLILLSFTVSPCFFLSSGSTLHFFLFPSLSSFFFFNIFVFVVGILQAKLVWLLRRQKEREGNSGIFFPFSPSPPSPHHPTGGLKGNPTGNNIKNNNNNDNQLFFFLGLYLSVESYNI